MKSFRNAWALFFSASAVLTWSGCKPARHSATIQFTETGPAETLKVQEQRARFSREIRELAQFKQSFDEGHVQGTCGPQVARTFECFQNRAETFFKRTGADTLSSHGLTLLTAVGEMAYEYERRGKPDEARETALTVDYLGFLLKMAASANGKRADYRAELSQSQPSFTLANEENLLWKFSVRAVERAEALIRKDEGSRVARILHPEHSERSPATDLEARMRARVLEVQRTIQKARVEWLPSPTGMALNSR